MMSLFGWPASPADSVFGSAGCLPMIGLQFHCLMLSGHCGAHQLPRLFGERITRK